MRTVDIITKKRDREELTREEINFFIQGFQSGEIADYQVSAWAMAVLLNGMNARETSDLTLALANSGDRLDLSDVVKFSVDKHSTGGVGDKTSLVVGPIVAACGVPVGKMSGRGLGFTGGTLDKLESIAGFDVSMTTAQFKAQLKEIGIVLAGQTASLAPADGLLYALRDVTGTVPSIALIASSVMSKKIAGGADAIVLDVKAGLGAFMQTVAEAAELASMMVDIGVHADRQVVALISDMNQPLGHAVGNALEVREAIETLQGGGPQDLVEHCLVISAHMLLLSQKVDTLVEARAAAERALVQGAAMEKFLALVSAQAGDISMVKEPDRLPSAPVVHRLQASRDGYVSLVHAREIGLTAMELGAGRSRKGEAVDHGVGLVISCKVGDEVTLDEPLAEVHARSEEAAQAGIARLGRAIQIADSPIDPLPLFYETMG
jgi:pyrimidine-nucleoside phosphorylase